MGINVPYTEEMEIWFSCSNDIDPQHLELEKVRLSETPFFSFANEDN